MSDQKKNRLVDIRITELSGVDKGANRRRHLIVKREGGESMDHSEKPSLLTRLGEGLRGIFKSDAKDFSQNIATQKLRETFWQANDALRESIYSILNDEELDNAAKVQQAAVSLGQFQEFMLGLVSAILKPEAIEKAGAKISADRLKRLQECHKTLGEIIDEAQKIVDDPVNKGEEDDQVKPEDIKKMLDEALKLINERLDAVEKGAKEPPAGDPPAGDPPAGDVMKAEDIKKILDDSLNPLVKRIEVVEKARGIKKSINGQDNPGDDEETVAKEFGKGMFSGLL